MADGTANTPGVYVSLDDLLALGRLGVGEDPGRRVVSHCRHQEAPFEDVLKDTLSETTKDCPARHRPCYLRATYLG